MNTDSLLALKLKNLRTQPPTLRGKMIDWYCSLENRPHMRVVVFSFFIVFILLHTMAFTLMIGYEFSVSIRWLLIFIASLEQILSESGVGDASTFYAYGLPIVNHPCPYCDHDLWLEGKFWKSLNLLRPRMKGSCRGIGTRWDYFSSGGFFHF